MSRYFHKIEKVNRWSAQVDKLKITFAIASDFSGLGGLELMLLQYYKYADKSKYDINVVCLDKGKRNETLNFLNKNGIDKEKIITIKDVDTKFSFLLKNRYARKIFYGVARPIATFLIYVSGTGNILGRHLDSQVVYLFNNEINFYFRKFKGLVIGHNGMWVINERSISFHLIRIKLLWNRIDGMRLFPQYRKFVNKLNREYSFVLQNGIETELYTSPTDVKNWEEVRFLFVGRLDYGKGFDLLISAFSSIPKNINYKLFIVGIGELQSIIPVDDKRIKYYGRMDREDVAKLYRNSDILVLPSRWEPYGLVILEALSCGVGIVVTEKLKGTYDDFEKLSVLRYTRLDHDSISKNMQEMAARINEIRSNHCSVHKLIVEKHDVAKVTKLLLDELNNKYLNFWKDDSFH